MNSQKLVPLIGVCSVFLSALLPMMLPTVWGQSIRISQSREIVGVIRDLAPGKITIVDQSGVAHQLKVQNKQETFIVLGETRIRFPAKIRVTGFLPTKLLKTGMTVRINVDINSRGKTSGEISKVVVESKKDIKLDHEFEKAPQDIKDFQPCRITGRVISASSRQLKLAVPDSNLNRKQVVVVKLSDDCQLEINDDHLDRVTGGDRVVATKVVKASTGELAIAEIQIKLTAPRTTTTTSFDDELELRFSQHSDDPSEPREVRSSHFLLYTDISDRSAQILLAKLETMHKLVSGYFRAAPKQPIICYVVRDLKQWPEGRLKPKGIEKIQQRTGVTLWSTLRQGSRIKTDAEVYSCEDHGICQHEAVHAFCALTFGSTGPVWFSEGMAEMGQYWKPNQRAVDINPGVIGYLQNAAPKKMEAIVAAGQITGDSWQAYAWRWALCHLLANNPNYSKRFKSLGLNLMAKRNNDSFTNAFGPVADNISFEYDQFVENFGNGYRVDLCAWDWETHAKKLSKSKKVKTTVKARFGWQATRLSAAQGISYDYSAEGSWGIGKGTESLSADGSPTGEGRLIGALLKNFKLSPPFELGGDGAWVAPSEGQLFVRCRDAWTELEDNSGTIQLTIKRTKQPR